MFTKACEYGIRACVIIAQHSAKGNRLSLKKIAGAIDSPEAFTSKILQNLAKHDIIISVQGAYGGFEMDVSKFNKITLKAIVDAIDGEQKYSGCVLGLTNCSDDNPCPAHKNYKHIKNQFIDMISTMTIQEMINDTEKGKAFLKL